MRVDRFISSLRSLVLEHPDMAHAEIVLSPHGDGHQQIIISVHLSPRGTKVVIEAEKK